MQAQLLLKFIRCSTLQARANQRTGRSGTQTAEGEDFSEKILHVGVYEPECTYTVCDIQQWYEGAFWPCVRKAQSRRASQLHNGCARQPHGGVCPSPREVSGCKITKFSLATKYFMADNQHFNIFSPCFSHSAQGLQAAAEQGAKCSKTALYRGI